MKLLILSACAVLVVAQTPTPFPFPAGAYPGQSRPFSRFGPPQPFAPNPFKPQPAIKVVPSTPSPIPKYNPVGIIPQQYRPHHPQEFIPILRQTSDIQPGGGYQWDYATANGISAYENADIVAVGPEQATKTVQGGYSYTSLEGIPVEVTYTADANGFHPHVVVHLHGGRRN